MSTAPSPVYNPIQPAGTFQETAPVSALKTVNKFYTEEGQRQCVTAFDLRYILQSLFGLSPTNPNQPGDDFSLTEITQRLQDLEDSLDSNVVDLQEQIDSLDEKGIGANTNVITLDVATTIIVDQETERSRKLRRSAKKIKHRSTFEFGVERNHTYLVRNEEGEQSVLFLSPSEIDQFKTGDTIYFRNSSVTFDSGNEIVPPAPGNDRNVIIAIRSPYRFMSASNLLNNALSLRPGAVYMGVFNRGKIVRPDENNVQIQDSPTEAFADVEGVFEQAIEFPTDYLIPVL